MRTLLLAALLLGACAPSPLFVSRRPYSTPGEIPRDERGEPLWKLIRAPRPAPPKTPQPAPLPGYAPN